MQGHVKACRNMQKPVRRAFKSGARRATISEVKGKGFASARRELEVLCKASPWFIWRVDYLTTTTPLFRYQHKFNFSLTRALLCRGQCSKNGAV